MFRLTILPAAVLLLICSSAIRSAAQQDSTHLDAGFLTLKKEFTQQIVIKGSDLEQMPFVNLSDAIQAWLYGVYTLRKKMRQPVSGSSARMRSGR